MKRSGQDHPNAKLSDSDVDRIRALRNRGMSYRKIGEMVGCSMWTARDIADRRTRAKRCALADYWL